MDRRKKLQKIGNGAVFVDGVSYRYNGSNIKIISIDSNPILFKREYTKVFNKLWITVTFKNSTEMN